MAKKTAGRPVGSKTKDRKTPKRLSRDGLPINPRDWTRTDWQDLHEAMERAKNAIRRRHSE
jgi:hypothetical protein